MRRTWPSRRSPARHVLGHDWVHREGQVQVAPLRAPLISGPKFFIASRCDVLHDVVMIDPNLSSEKLQCHSVRARPYEGGGRRVGRQVRGSNEFHKGQSPSLLGSGNETIHMRSNSLNSHNLFCSIQYLLFLMHVCTREVLPMLIVSCCLLGVDNMQILSLVLHIHQLCETCSNSCNKGLIVFLSMLSTASCIQNLLQNENIDLSLATAVLAGHGQMVRSRAHFSACSYIPII